MSIFSLKKLLTALLFIIGIFWLLLSPKKTNRINAINHFLSQGLIGNISQTDEQRLTTLLSTIQVKLDIREPICLNCPFDTNKKLRIFICEPSLKNITHCSEGNAVYDAILNSIFIDKNLISNEKWIISKHQDKSSLQFIETYLQFILLHEIGHYTLHRNVQSQFDVSLVKNNLLKFELEADSFALRNFISLIETDTSNIFFNENVFSNLGLQIQSNTSASDKAIASLTLIGRNICLGMLFGFSPYSIYYSDKAHPSYLDRSINFISIALDEMIEKNIFYARAEITKLFLEEVRNISSQNSIIEVDVPNRILDITYNKNDIVIQTTDSILFRLKLENKLLNLTKPLLRLPSDKIITSKIPLHFENKLFSYKNNELFYIDNSNIYNQSNNEWKQMQYQLKQNSLSYYSLTTQVQPVDSIIRINDNKFSYCVTSNKIHSQISHDKIDEFVKAEICNPNIDIHWNDILMIEPIGHLTLTETTENGIGLYGIMKYDFLNDTINEIIKFNLESPKLSIIKRDLFWNAKSRILYNKNKNLYYLVTSQNDENKELKMDIWELRENMIPKHISAKYFLHSKVITQQEMPVEPTFYKDAIVYLSEDKYICNWDGDMIYLLNLTEGSIKPIFSFGFNTISIRPFRKGVFVLFMPLSYKFYIFNTETRKI